MSLSKRDTTLLGSRGISLPIDQRSTRGSIPSFGPTSWLERHRDAIVAAIVADLLPAHPALDAVERERVTVDVAAFVVSQVRALPDFLRLPYGVGLFAFEYLPILRWGRPFRALGPDRRTAYLALWTTGGLGATRNFMKLLRSCTLLAYYDHPTVRARLEAADPPAAPLRWRAESA